MLALMPLLFRQTTWQYVTAGECEIFRAVVGGLGHSDRYLRYSPRGQLRLFIGYACNGVPVPGGFAANPWNMRAAFFLDAHQQLARRGCLPKARQRKAAELIFLRMMREDIDHLFRRGNAKIYSCAARRTQRATAWIMYQAARKFGGRYWQHPPLPPVFAAP